MNDLDSFSLEDEDYCVNLPYHLAQGGMVDDWCQLLADLEFVGFKCAKGMTYDLITDYNTALNFIRKAQSESQGDLGCKASLREYTKNLSAFNQFVNSECHGLVKFSDKPGFCLQQAYNSAKSGPVAEAAQAILNTNPDDILLLHLPSQRPDYTPHPALLKTLEGHTAEVESVSITQDGKRAISASRDGTLRIWDLDTGKCLDKLKGHTGWWMSITPDGKRAVSGSTNGTLRVWDLDAGKCLKTLEGHTGGVWSVSITPDGKRAVSASTRNYMGRYYTVIKADNTLRVWDLDREECLSILEIPNSCGGVSVTADGRRAVFAVNPIEEKYFLQVWDLDTQECQATIECPVPIEILSITPDGKRAIVAHSNLVLSVWDLEPKRHSWVESWQSRGAEEPQNKGFCSLSPVIATEQKIGECIGILKGHTREVTGVCITADGKRAVSASEDGTLRVWYLEREECLKILRGHSDEVNCVSMTPDGKVAISGGGGIWAGNQDHTLKVWDLEGECLTPIDRSPEEAVLSSGSQPAGTTGYMMSMIKPYLEAQNLEAPALPSFLFSVQGLQSVSITPNGKRVVLSGEQERTHILRVCNLDDGTSKILAQEDKWLTSVASLTPDGRKIIWGCAGENIWSVLLPSLIGIPLRVWDIDSGKCLKQLRLRRKVNDVDGIKVTPDGTKILVKGDIFGMMDLETGILLWLWGVAGFGSGLSITSDGMLAVTDGGDNLRVWDIDRGECLGMFKGHTNAVKSTSITPDGKIAVSGSLDKTLRVWNLESRECLGILEGQTAPVESVGITPDGRRVISVGWDNTLRVWDLRSQDCIAVYQARSRIAKISEITASGCFVYGTSTGEVIVLENHNLLPTPPIVTPVRLWLFGKVVKRLLGISYFTGQWDNRITALCPWCSQRFPVAPEVLETIADIIRTANLAPQQSPCLELADEAWEEPHLFSECPNCRHPLRFNPFILDKREKSINSAVTNR